MSKDTSLSEFAGTAEDESADERTEVEPVEEERVADESNGTDEDASEPNLDEIEPARATYDWTPDGADCACCGASVEKRWRADDWMVCADCKEW